jgi:hypothetical protein
MSGELRALAQKVESYVRGRLDLSLSVDKRLLGELGRLTRERLLPDDNGDYKIKITGPESVEILIFYSDRDNEGREPLELSGVTVAKPPSSVITDLIAYLTPEYSKTINEPNPFHPVPVLMRERKLPVMSLTLSEAEKMLIAVRKALKPPRLAGRPATYVSLDEFRTALENGINRSLWEK